VKGRKPGGQKGCKGKTLFRSDGPDHVVSHFPSGCSHCGHALDEGMSVGVETRYALDLPAPSPWLSWTTLSIAVHAPIANRKPGPLSPGVSLHRHGPNLTAPVACPGECQLIPVKRLRGHCDAILPFTGNMLAKANPGHGTARLPNFDWFGGVEHGQFL